MPFRTPAPHRRARRPLWAAIAATVVVLSLAGVALAAKSPTATTSPPDPTLVFSDSADLLGVITPNSVPTSYAFQYGRTTAYGRTTPVRSAGSGKSDVPVDEPVTGLKPNTTYHYRIVAIPGSGADGSYGPEVFGADEHFKTAPALNVRFVGRHARLKHRKAVVKLHAVGEDGDTARGRLTLRARINGKLKKIGTAKYRIAVGKTKKVRVRVSKKAKRTLAAATHHKLKVRATAKTKRVHKPVTKKLTLVG